MSGHCTFVNPTCPTDLCVLEYGHLFSTRKRHITGTTYGSANTSREEQERLLRDPMETGWANGYLAKSGTSDDELVRLGYEEAERLWPNERHNDQE